MSKQDQQRIYSLFPQLPVLYHAGLALVFDDSTAMLLGHLLFWQGYGRNKKEGWIYLAGIDIEAKLGLSRYQQERSIAKLKSIGVLAVKRSGHYGTNMFLVDVDKLEIYITRLLETDKRLCKKLANYIARNPQANTKSSQIKTAKNYEQLLKMKDELIKRKGLPR